MTTPSTPSSVGRRTVLGGAAAGAVLTPLAALGARAQGNGRGHQMRKRPHGPDYGPLYPVKDQTTGLELISLPKGFEYISYGWTGSIMDDGRPTPGAHDGMAAFRQGDQVRLVRNHELRRGDQAFHPTHYDPTGPGGTTTIVFDPDAGKFVESYASLAGTAVNCAGGPTPWGTWLSCEETFYTSETGQRHGYVFEVPTHGVSSAEPLTQMGRFVHEAVAVDPSTGIVYLTEDATPSGFYRFLPNRPGDLDAGGELQMLRIERGEGSYVTYADGTGERYQTSWVTIDEPDPADDGVRTVQQGIAKGGAQFARLEGAWWGNDVVNIVSTSGGPDRNGQVFTYDPRTGELVILFASPDETVLDNPDNICVSPRGGIVLCEDGGGDSYLHGLTTDGEIFPFALNTVVLDRDGVAGSTVRAGDYHTSEWCGSTFEPKNGNWMFVNIQTPGITLAITGPWRKGSL
ncbi:DUF839 domain-containing protein [Kytococcus sedentarius]|uniref:Predicted phosphatase n=1 Tax=Kytococcus sedentarius (strain ATCC 14392 / DSM 20547 / JCM 11482 / CCUG 33030 / NBRC 15357 / NCTC 11040 / CCM 314 / 541) TaxID=478801 RepID=C7NLI5_KYTSD|nr:alkaline phosphatase PhoX [Kytococcus sedentarius]ACV07181.1 predicted phosphatase [Kytococcus sedentarius DSM 20547]QQB63156.1 DUF839 domain-containing protein [Kytococcus sedentarius]QRO86958.1 DUF839 domain-containing protein [Kytococcus sedentarius]STX13986.1 Predicted phosphatase [Kytococcus sedentarius]